MAKRRRQPVWLSRVVVDAIHHDQLREHGGLRGIRDDNALESALARPQQKFHYEPDSDLSALAAAYGYGFVRNHPYRDGNKRIGFLVVATFLAVNGYELEASDSEVVSEILALAEGSVEESELADWIRSYLKKVSSSTPV